jgi:hypothetical protein
MSIVEKWQAVSLVADPICPVETEPPDPSCTPRPVEGAVVAAVTVGGDRLEAVSDAAGHFGFDLPEGEVTITFLPVEGLMGTPIVVSLAEGSTIDLGLVAYDTGIR